jgi:excisionase family DNA binding protein
MSVDSSLEVKLLTVGDVAAILNVSVATVRRLQQQLEIPYLKIGGSVRFLYQDVFTYMEKQRVESIGK